MLETRLSRSLQKSISYIVKRIQFLQNNLTLLLCLLFIGFLTGNMFGTFLSSLRTYLPWDGWIVIMLVFSIEVCNYATYHSKNRQFLVFLIHPKTIQKHIWNFLNYFKLGLMVGFFIDAFKVGS
uniref:hypothetical chloroplast RF20 n=1 Tax=Watanabea sichuanensis TaxID=2704660 RepID=UPI0024114418|nr:hypothetical chloroplast RF20 [Watanabea sichuanensis]WDY13192.1 hypothetical chloroplast RF20 [Watanabea sichuanensis]